MEIKEFCGKRKLLAQLTIFPRQKLPKAYNVARNANR